MERLYVIASLSKEGTALVAVYTNQQTLLRDIQEYVGYRLYVIPANRELGFLNDPMYFDLDDTVYGHTIELDGVRCLDWEDRYVKICPFAEVNGLRSFPHVLSFDESSGDGFVDEDVLGDVVDDPTKVSDDPPGNENT